MTALGLRKITAVLNLKLALIGLLPPMVEPTPFQRSNFLQVVQQYHPLMIRIGDGPGAFVSIPRRSCIAEAQAEGAVLWETKKTARDAWRELESSVARIGDYVTGAAPTTNRAEADLDRPAAAAAGGRHRRIPRADAPRVRRQRSAGTRRDDPRAGRAAADLGAAESAAVRPLGAQLRRAAVAGFEARGPGDRSRSSTRRRTATTR